MHSTSNLDDGYIGSGHRIRRSIKKYGKENFKCEILEMLPDRNLLKQREKDIVNEELLNDSLCMNLVYGGGGGFISPEGVKKGRKKTDEILEQRYGKDFRKIIFENYRNNLTDFQKMELSNKIKEGQKKSGYDFGSSFRGKKHSQETKDKIGKISSIKQKGKNNSQYGTCWITNGKENRKIKKDSELPVGWIIGRV